MQQVIDQLHRVRRTARAMLLAQRVLQWLAGVLVTVLLLGLIDSALNLPGWLRLALAVSMAIIAGYWLSTRLHRAASFMPALSTLALRAEQIYPQLADRLASSVEFAADFGRYADPPRTGSLAQASIDEIRHQLTGVSLTRLIDPTRTLRIAMLAFIVISLWGVVVYAAPQACMLGLQRWLLPLGDTQWPRRTEIQSVVSDSIWPADTPVALDARIHRGYRANLRTSVVYRFALPDGTTTPWSRELMNEQAGVDPGLYQRLLDVRKELGGVLVSQPTLAGVQLEFYFQADDDQTTPQTLTLVDRPSVTAMRVLTQPPAYAHDLVPAQDLTIPTDTGAVVTVSALQGSQVHVGFQLNKPVQVSVSHMASTLPGLADAPEIHWNASLAPIASIDARFTLEQTLQTLIHLRDEHNLENLSDRTYRFESIVDQSPVATWVQPMTDQSVLASAVIELEATGRDDVGVASLVLEAQLPKRLAAPREGAGASPSPDEPGPTLVLAQTNDRKAQLDLRHTLDLKPLALVPGDELILTAIASDVYERDGRQHEAVRSSPRRLRVIDPATLIAQIRNELVGLRQQAIRLADRQRQIMTEPTATAQSRQRQLTGNIAAQHQLVKNLEQRVQTNRLEDAQVQQLLSDVDRLLNRAEARSQAAQDELKQAQQKQSAQKPSSESESKAEDQRQSKNESDNASENARDDDPERAEARAQQDAQDALKQAQQQQSSQQQAGDSENKNEAQNQRQSKTETSSDSESENASAGADQSGEQDSEENKAAKQHEQQAREHQDATATALDELVALLDQGRDSLALQMQLRQLANAQEALARDTQAMLPRTLGQPTESLSPEDRQQLEQLAARQEALEAQARALVQQMQATAEALQRQGASPQEQAAAAALSEAAAIARRQGLNQSMQQAAQSTQQNQLSAAGQQQQQSMQAMQQMMQTLQDQQRRQQEILRRHLRQLREQIERLVAQQQAQIQATEQAQVLAGLDGPMQQLWRGTLVVEQTAREDQSTVEVAEQLGRAGGNQSQAITQLRAGDRDATRASQRQSLAALQRALELLQRAQEQADREQAKQEREQLREAYEKLAAQQHQLLEQTLEAKPQAEQPTRLERARLVDLGHQQDDLRGEIASLREKVQQTLVFKHLHQVIDDAAGRIVTRLRAADASAAVNDDQRFVAQTLLTLAEALKDDKPNTDDEFSQGAGGGGGAGSAQPPMIPPGAELKALRGVQLTIYQRTRAVAEDRQIDTATRQRTLSDLAAQQRGLSQVGREMIERIKQQSIMQQLQPPAPEKQP